MRLTGIEQHMIEQALDEALIAPGEPRTHQLVERALRVMSERPEGARRIRADAGSVRSPHTRDIWGEAWDPT